MKKQVLIGELSKLQKKDFVDKRVLTIMLDQINQENNLTRPENPFDHFCAFFVPIHKQSRSIYLGDHIKAGSWIPPGGHVELNESPCQTVVRECLEELQYKPQEKDIHIFDVSITHIVDNPRSGKCKTHFDIWYLVDIPEKIDFVFDKSEYRDADWFSFEKAINQMTNKNYLHVVKKII